MKFEKGFWNLKELEIIEWTDPKQKGFMTHDLETAVEELKKVIPEWIRPDGENKDMLHEKIDRIMLGIDNRPSEEDIVGVNHSAELGEI